MIYIYMIILYMLYYTYSNIFIYEMDTIYNFVTARWIACRKMLDVNLPNGSSIHRWVAGWAGIWSWCKSLPKPTGATAWFTGLTKMAISHSYVKIPVAISSMVLPLTLEANHMWFLVINPPMCCIYLFIVLFIYSFIYHWFIFLFFF